MFIYTYSKNNPVYYSIGSNTYVCGEETQVLE